MRNNEKWIIIFFSILLFSINNSRAEISSSVVADYLRLYEEILEQLPREVQFLNGNILFTENFLELRSKTKYLTKKTVLLDGVDVSAVNERGDLSKIIISEDHWNKLSLESKKLLILHEQISLAGIDDKDYANSNRLFDRITNGLNLNIDYIALEVAKCESSFLNKISKVDIEKSISITQRQLTMYVALHAGCTQYINLWTRWGWNVLKLVPEASRFVANGQHSIEKKIELQLALTRAELNHSYLLDTATLGGSGGGQETNGGDGVVAEYLMIFKEIKKKMPSELLLSNGTVFLRNQLVTPTFWQAKKYSHLWENLSSSDKRSFILLDQFDRQEEGADLVVARSAEDRIFNGLTRTRGTIIPEIKQCNNSYFQRLTKKDLENNHLEFEMREFFEAALKYQCSDFLNLWGAWELGMNICPNPIIVVLESGTFNPHGVIRSVDALLSNGLAPNFLCRGDRLKCELTEKTYSGSEAAEIKKMLNCI